MMMMTFKLFAELPGEPFALNQPEQRVQRVRGLVTAWDLRLEQQLADLDVKPPVILLNEHTSFWTLSPRDMFERLLRWVNSRKLGYKFKPKSSSLRVFDTYNGEQVQYKVRVYQTDECKYIVEVQRKHGCVVAFNNMYRLLLVALGSLVEKP